MKGNLEELTKEELEKNYADLKKGLREERFKAITSKVDNPKKIKELKKSIARILTLKREFALGLRKPKGN